MSNELQLALQKVDLLEKSTNPAIVRAAVEVFEGLPERNRLEAFKQQAGQLDPKDALNLWDAFARITSSPHAPESCDLTYDLICEAAFDVVRHHPSSR